ENSASSVLRGFKFAGGGGAWVEAKIDPNGGAKPDGSTFTTYNLGLNNLGSNQWGFQFHRDGLNVMEGQSYSLSFWARSTDNRRITVNLLQDRLPYEFQGFTGHADLQNNWRRYN